MYLVTYYCCQLILIPLTQVSIATTVVEGNLDYLLYSSTVLIRGKYTRSATTFDNFSYLKLPHVNVSSKVRII